MAHEKAKPDVRPHACRDFLFIGAFRRRGALPRPADRLALSFKRRLLGRAALCAIAGCIPATGPAWGQGQSQVQYVHDAAGNLIQVTRTTLTPLPDLTVSNLSVGAISVNGNGSFNIPVAFQVNNIGTKEALATWYDRGYLSANAVLHDTDQPLGGFNTRAARLAVGASYSVSATFTTSTTTNAGNYMLIVKADGGAGAAPYSPTGPNAVAESNEMNNTQAVAIIVPAVTKPDLVMSNTVVGAVAVKQNGSYSVPVTYTVTNTGALPAPASWYDLAYLSSDAVLDNADQNLGGYNLHSTALAPGASYTVTTTFSTTATTAPGDYTLFIKADGRGAVLGVGTNTDNGVVAEVNEANNLQAMALTLPPRPDLAVSNAVVGAIAVRQNGAYSVPVAFTVTNTGGVAALPNWYDLAYLSSDAVLDNADQNLSGYNLHSTALAPGASYTVSTTFSTTTTTAPGDYTLFIKADGRGAVLGVGTNTDTGLVAEGNEANNVQALALTLPGKPDLVVSNIGTGTIIKNANGSRSIPVTYTVTNAGGAAALANWYDLAYLSSDAVLDNADQNLAGYILRSTALAPGASYAITTTFTTNTTTASGNYTLFIKADGRGTVLGVGTNTDSGLVAEGNEANNVASVPVVLP
jgi:hypothetical protein